MTYISVFSVSFFLLLLGGGNNKANAQTNSTSLGSYPNKSIRVIVPFPPGGAADLLPRIISQKLIESLGQNFVVENKPGGGSTIGVSQGAKAAADGYTLTLVTNGFTVNPSLYPNLPYDTLKDFVPIVRLAASPHVLVINPDRLYKSVNELAHASRQRTGTLTFASVGSGTISHLEGEMLKKLANMPITHVPYKGLAPALTDVMGGHVTMLFAAVPDIAQQVKEGKLRALAITSASRSRLLPELPTMSELGYLDFKFEAWFGLLAPAGVPPEVVRILNEELNRILRLPEISQRLLSQGLEPVGGTSQEFSTFLREEISKYGKIVKESGARID